ncbi:hypothetical protein HYV86_05600 [Candidatus Woesearchaeota archaeon]|nr:hypothetical protein [Candidatus Woesearchaeota archaeon]
MGTLYCCYTIAEKDIERALHALAKSFRPVREDAVRLASNHLEEISNSLPLTASYPRVFFKLSFKDLGPYLYSLGKIDQEHHHLDFFTSPEGQRYDCGYNPLESNDLIVAFEKRCIPKFLLTDRIDDGNNHFCFEVVDYLFQPSTYRAEVEDQIRRIDRLGVKSWADKELADLVDEHTVAGKIDCSGLPVEMLLDLPKSKNDLVMLREELYQQQISNHLTVLGAVARLFYDLIEIPLQREGFRAQHRIVSFAQSWNPYVICADQWRKMVADKGFLRPDDVPHTYDFVMPALKD